LSCIYALKRDEEKALRYLNLSLSENEIDTVFVEKDEDWKEYLSNKNFRKLIEKYKK
jgi:hypothetical protein